MKDQIFYWGASTAIFWPWAVAALDLGYWMLTGSQATRIPWASARGVFMVMWPVLAILAIGAMASLFGNSNHTGE